MNPYCGCRLAPYFGSTSWTSSFESNCKTTGPVRRSIELILLAVNINLISFSIFSGDIVGQIFTMLTLTVAAAEAAIGLAIIVIYYRNKGSIRVEDIHGMKG